jgi:hypothetical protein
LEGRGCGLILRQYPGNLLEELRKITKKLGDICRSHGRDYKPGPSEHEAGVLTTRPRRSVLLFLAQNDRTRLTDHQQFWTNNFNV